MAAEFRILGPLEVLAGGDHIEVRGSKRRALLAFLLVNHDHAVSLDRVVDAVWGDAADAGRRSALTYLSQLRRLFSAHLDARIETLEKSYRLRLNGDDMDVNRFEALVEAAGAERIPERRSTLLKEALACWRGPALDEFRGFEWADPVAEALELRRVHVLQDRFDVELWLGHEREVAIELEAVVRHYPLHEPFWAQRMVALYRCGRQSDALNAYAAFRRHLVDELGVEPSQALVDLERRILDHDPSLLAAAPSEAAESPRVRADRDADTATSGTVTFYWAGDPHPELLKRSLLDFIRRPPK